jgi:ribosomal protein L37AE/L43A
MQNISVIERCENCGLSIGRLEKAYVWEERIVCGACYAKLNVGPIRKLASALGEEIAHQDPSVRCPSCGTTEVVKASVVFQSGTSMHGGTYFGVSQTLLASKWGPPQRPQSYTWVWICFAAVFCMSAVAALVFVLLIAAVSSGAWVSLIVLPIILAAIATLLFCEAFRSEKRLKAADARWWSAYQQWENVWVCRKCEHGFYLKNGAV